MNNVNIVINGFGRIGRNIFRQLLDSRFTNYCFTINDPFVSIDNAIYLIKYDSIFGHFRWKVTKTSENEIIIDKKGTVIKIQYCCKSNIQDIVLNGQDYLVDASGQKYTIDEYNLLIKKGCKHILVSRWLDSIANTFMWGYSDKTVLERNRIISCGICDTVGIAPIINLLIPYDVKSINIVTLHPWLSYQNVLDGQPRDVTHINFPNYQIGRGISASIIPKETSIAKIFKDLFQNIHDKLFIMTYRVPTEIVTCCDLNVSFNKDINREEILNIIKDSRLYEIYEDPMVSRDFVNSYSTGAIDINWLKVNQNNLHLTIWYNNESGYANSIVKTLKYLIVRGI